MSKLDTIYSLIVSDWCNY